MKVVLNNQRAFFARQIRDEDRETVLELLDKQKRVNPENITSVDFSYSINDLESDRQNLKCLCGAPADHMCECGCPCCGEDPCGFCNGSVRLIGEHSDSLIPRTSATVS